MARESRITVNGVELTEGQAMAVRVAVTLFEGEKSEAVYDGRASGLDAGYAARLNEVLGLMGLDLEPARPLEIVGVDAPDGKAAGEAIVDFALAGGFSPPEAVAELLAAERHAHGETKLALDVALERNALLERRIEAVRAKVAEAARNAPGPIKMGLWQLEEDLRAVSSSDEIAEDIED